MGCCIVDINSVLVSQPNTNTAINTVCEIVKSCIVNGLDVWYYSACKLDGADIDAVVKSLPKNVKPITYMEENSNV